MYVYAPLTHASGALAASATHGRRSAESHARLPHNRQHAETGPSTHALRQTLLEVRARIDRLTEQCNAMRAGAAGGAERQRDLLHLQARLHSLRQCATDAERILCRLRERGGEAAQR